MIGLAATSIIGTLGKPRVAWMGTMTADIADNGSELLSPPITTTDPISESTVHIASTSSSAAGPIPTPAEELAIEVNQFRAQHNLPPLKLDPALNRSAQEYAARLGVSNFFGHDDPDDGCSKPRKRIEAAGYTDWTVVGENLAAGFPTAKAALKAFALSPSHRALILNTSVMEIGSGYYYDSADVKNVRLNAPCPYGGEYGPYRHYWVLHFGARNQGNMPVLPIIINGEAITTESRLVTVHVYGETQAQPGWAKQIRFSENALDWSPYESWSPTKQIILSPGNGSKTLYAQITNGSSTLTVSDTIYLNESQAASAPDYSSRVYVPLVIR